MQQNETKRNEGDTERVTINAEFDRLSPDARILPIALQQMVLDGPYQSRTYEVELDGKVGSTHFDRAFTARFTPISTIGFRGDKIARSNKEV